MKVAAQTTTVKTTRTKAATVRTAISKTVAPTTTMTMTTTTVANEDAVKIKVVNYTLISNSASKNAAIGKTSGGTGDSKSYSLRLHIKGYKWNEKFSDIGSPESQEFLKKKILPLLYRNLNLTHNEMNDIKLLRLFRGKKFAITSKATATTTTTTTTSALTSF